ncbi:hypothetical protein KAX02_02170, partial [candidate division WOR-3 bacterium]|nr:hypothetical protein [candidate division WOR-3 bacterium]
VNAVTALHKHLRHLRSSIYDISGRLIRTIPLPFSPITHHSSVIWDGKDNSGEEVFQVVYTFSDLLHDLLILIY